MEQRAPTSNESKEAIFFNMPPAANQELLSDKELHEVWQEKYLRRSRRQERATFKASLSRQ